MKWLGILVLCIPAAGLSVLITLTGNWDNVLMLVVMVVSIASVAMLVALGVHLMQEGLKREKKRKRAGPVPMKEPYTYEINGVKYVNHERVGK